MKILSKYYQMANIVTKLTKRFAYQNNCIDFIYVIKYKRSFQKYLYKKVYQKLIFYYYSKFSYDDILIWINSRMQVAL